MTQTTPPVTAESLISAMLDDDEIRNQDLWGTIPFGDLSDFAWNIARIATASALRHVAADPAVTPDRLRQLARDIDV